jgi:hypothetical protein
MIDEPYRVVEAISNRREYIENELARIFPELPAILGCDLGVFRFLFLVFVGKLTLNPSRRTVIPKAA